VPLAPWVGKTESWVGLVFKRLIRYAADNGFEGIAWTTGKQQVDRYPGLAQQVHRIEWVDTSNYASGAPGQRRVSVETTRGTSMVMNVGPDGHVSIANHGVAGAADFEGQPLSAMVGTELARRIMSEEYGNVRGGDLTLGGSGMHEVYGNERGLKPDGTPAIYPNIAKGVLRKLGGGELTTIELALEPRKLKPDEEAWTYEGPEHSEEEMVRLVEQYRREGWHGEPPSTMVAGQLSELRDAIMRGEPWQASANQHLSEFAAEMLGGRINREPVETYHYEGPQRTMQQVREVRATWDINENPHLRDELAALGRVEHAMANGMAFTDAMNTYGTAEAAHLLGGDFARVEAYEPATTSSQAGFYLEGETAVRARGPMTLMQAPAEYSYRDFPGTLDNPVSREELLAAGDARVAEAERAELALGTAINCALTMGG
jgi:hypothetical protein